MTTDTYKIPKKIHYCWFGGEPLPERYKKYIEGWKRLCPDYEIIEWNESNYDIKKNKYMAQAYEKKIWGFVPDYARLDIIYNEGGIYLDTDVELLKNLDELLKYDAFLGFQDNEHVSPGLGFGAVEHHEGIKKMRDIYIDKSFIDKKGKVDLLPSPSIITESLVKHGLIKNGQEQKIMGINILPTEVLCPKSVFTGDIIVTDKTISIHHFDGTWVSKLVKRWNNVREKLTKKVGYKAACVITRIISFPDRAINKLKGILKL